MNDFLEGALLPFRLVGWLLRTTWFLISTTWNFYMAAVAAIGKPWDGIIHSTIFFGFGQAIVWYALS